MSILAAVPTRRERYGYVAALALTLFRLVLALPLALIAAVRGSGWAAAVILTAGFLSDVFDGMVARRFGVATEGLRRLDSAVDTVFYVAAGACAWRLHSTVIASHRLLIAGVIGTLLFNHAVELWKFGREASYHAWLARAWGAALFASLLLLFTTGDGRLLTIALWVGIASHVENLLITLVLPRWEHDVPSVVAALARRRRPGA